jgi:hypothetical protein
MTDYKLSADERAVLEILTEGRKTDLYLKTRLGVSVFLFAEIIKGLETQKLIAVDGGFTFTAYAITEAGVYALATATNTALASAQADHAAAVDGDTPMGMPTFTIEDLETILSWAAPKPYDFKGDETQYVEAATRHEVEQAIGTQLLAVMRERDAANAKIARALAIEPYQQEYDDNYAECARQGFNTAHARYRKALTDDSAT